MKKIIIFCFAFALLGAKAPEWFSKPKLNSLYLYGFGSASSIALAKQNAMIDLSYSLQANVEANFNQETKRDDSALSSYASQQSNLYTAMTDLLKIEAKKVECIQNECYVQVEIEKSNLLQQLSQKIQTALNELNQLNSPFDYAYKKEVLYPKILTNYALYIALGGLSMEIPKELKKPSFDVKFEYSGDFSQNFKNVLEKTIQDDLTKNAIISSQAEWKIIIQVFQEDSEMVVMNLTANHNEEINQSASISDRKKPNISSVFFAKRLGVQAYKKIQKWGKRK